MHLRSFSRIITVQFAPDASAQVRLAWQDLEQCEEGDYSERRTNSGISLSVQYDRESVFCVNYRAAAARPVEFPEGHQA